MMSEMRKISCYIFPIALAILMMVTSCIKNDVPYPYLKGKITAFEVEGQIGETVINDEELTVTVQISDTIDIANVRVKRFEIMEEATISPEVSEYISLVEPVTYTLSTYPEQNYQWSIIGNQKILRFLRAENQVGKTEFDPDAKVAAFYVSKDLKNVHINEIRLGPSNSTITPDPKEIRDFRSPVKVTVSYRDVMEEWTLQAFLKEPEAITVSADAWSTHAYLYGSFAQGMSNPTFKYKEEGASDWLEVPQTDITTDGTDYSGVAKGLSPEKKYLFKAVAGGSEGEELEFATEKQEQLPNMNFDQWYQGGKAWFPALDETSLFWDSANGGTSDYGYVPTVPEETIVKSGKAAKLSTIEAKVLVITKLAAGNLYTGKFGQVVMSGGGGAILDFGRPYTSRPSAMKGWADYRPANVDGYCDAKYASMKGKPDHSQIYVLLTDWDAPRTVNTTTGNFIDVVNDPGIIGYGEVTYTENTNGYVEFNIPIEYRNHRQPKYVVVVCAASKYGDYFTGGVGSVLYVDEFSFVFDSDVKWK